MQRCCSKRCATHLRMDGPEVRARISVRQRKERPVTACAWCSKTFVQKRASPRQATRFCGTSCSAKWRMMRPETRIKSRELAARYLRESQPKVRPATSLRMRLHNPTQDPEVRAKISRAKSGKTFLSRGGKGQITPQQQSLADALGWGRDQIEYAIPTMAVRMLFQSPPPAYMVDLAEPRLKIAIEVDGKSHLSKKWKFLDRRKERLLASLGWYVLRFTNRRVSEDLAGIVKEIRSLMTSRSRTLTTTSPMVS